MAWTPVAGDVGWDGEPVAPGSSWAGSSPGQPCDCGGSGGSGSGAVTKASLGLDQVDNTHDAAKPVSGPQQAALDLKADHTSLALVATSGAYADLSGKPALKPVATSGAYGDLAGKPALIISPEMMGAVGDGASHPASTLFTSLAALKSAYPFATSLAQELDWLGWQAALKHGGPIASSGRSYMMANTTLTAIPPLEMIAGVSWVEGYGSYMEFGPMTAAAVGYPQNQDPTFQVAGAASPWQNSTQYPPKDGQPQITDFVFTGNGAVLTDPATDVSSEHFFAMGQPLFLGPGRWTASITYTATLGASYGAGNFNGPGAFISIQDAIGDGHKDFGAYAPLSALNVLSGPQTGTDSFDFEVDDAFFGALVVQGGGYLNLHVTDMRVIPYAANCAVLMTRDGSPDHYPVRTPFSGVKLHGPGRSSGIAAFKWKSFENVDGNVSGLQYTSIDNFQRAFSFEDGAYLINMLFVEVTQTDLCMTYTQGRNSGENFRFLSCGFNNCGTVVENGKGGEYTFTNCGFDYNQYVVKNNTGRIEFHGGRAEQNPPYTGGPGGPVYECAGPGLITWHGGYILLTNLANDPPIHLNDVTSKMKLFATQLYSLGSTPGGGSLAVSGLGVLSAPGGWLNGGNTNVGPGLLSLAPSMDVFGGGGRFEPHDANYPFKGEAAIGLQGGCYPNRANTATGQWTGTDVTCVVTTDKPHTGTRSLKVTKSTPYNAGDEGAQIVILIPVTTGQDVWFTGQIGNFDDVGTGASTIYFRAFFAQVVGYDSLQRPLFGQAYDFRGEPPNNIPIDLTGAAGWQSFSVNMAYASAQATPSATHMAVVLDCQVLPAMSFYLDDLIANVL